MPASVIPRFTVPSTIAGQRSISCAWLMFALRRTNVSDRCVNSTGGIDARDSGGENSFARSRPFWLRASATYFTPSTGVKRRMSSSISAICGVYFGETNEPDHDRLQPGLRQGVEEADLVVDRDRRGLDLHALAHALLGDVDAGVGHRSPHHPQIRGTSLPVSIQTLLTSV